MLKRKLLKCRRRTWSKTIPDANKSKFTIRHHKNNLAKSFEFGIAGTRRRWDSTDQHGMSQTSSGGLRGYEGVSFMLIWQVTNSIFSRDVELKRPCCVVELFFLLTARGCLCNACCILRPSIFPF